MFSNHSKARTRGKLGAQMSGPAESSSPAARLHPSPPDHHLCLDLPPQRAPLPQIFPLHRGWGRPPKDQIWSSAPSLENPLRTCHCSEALPQMLAVVFPCGLSKFTLCCPCSIISHCLVTGHQAHFPSCHTSQRLALPHLSRLRFSPQDSAQCSPPPGSLPRIPPIG